jgi:hypothetical protein
MRPSASKHCLLCLPLCWGLGVIGTPKVHVLLQAWSAGQQWRWWNL